MEARERLLRLARSRGAGYVARVSRIPSCDIQGCSRDAVVDGKTVHGFWGYMCYVHFMSLGVGLGVGKGQVLVLESEEEARGG
jgi:hypothetical protein